ncbi:MAG: ATP-binding protein [Clostridiales Family XIII bacterium]|jgi:AAA+ ATPase superfamily predicted ATPase|nr:ATP-binding protein [Clostridiales Family XIII bacterium]
MFVGRENELAALNKLYREKSFQMVVMYGRRRIGKTTLLSEFAADKPAIFFTAEELNDAPNLNRFSQKIYRFFELPDSVGSFRNWNDAFSFLAAKARERQFVLIFDEFPYAASANRSLKSILQTAIDHEFKDTGLFLILCGSHIGFMENEVLGYKSPLFGRRTAQIKLEGFDYYDAGKMLRGFSNEDKIALYACVGGTPHYLAQVKADESFEDNIKRLFFDMSGYLYNEPMMLLRQELREPAMYNAIIAAIAGGASKLNEIVTKIDEDRPKVNRYLQTLVNLKIVRRLCPFGENPQNSRRGIYWIADNCYDFWYRFVFSNMQEIESGSGDLVADANVFGEKLAAYIGKPPFETICLQYLQRANRCGKLPFTATSFGSWWGTDTREKSQTDFDAIAANRAEGKIILGECKWRSEVNAAFELQRLEAKSHLLSAFNDRYYYLFLKTSAGLRDLKQENAVIVSTDTLFEI